jgi:dTDP-4-dehydrorhamnose reductase
MKHLPNSSHLIHLSTDFIFDGLNGPYRETDIPYPPNSVYAQSKYISEKLVEKSELKWTIIRTVLVYGVVDFMSRSNIVLWAKDALSKGKDVNVVDDQFRSPTLAEDLAEGCILAALKGATGTYHISGKDFMSIIELVNTVADFWSLNKALIHPVKTANLGQAAERPLKTGFILEKAIKELGYNPHSFHEGLEIVDKQLKSN